MASLSNNSGSDLDQLFQLKAQVRQIASVVSASHNFTSSADDKEKDVAQRHFKEIFDRLMMCHGELDYAIQSLQTTQSAQPFDKFMQIIFDANAGTEEKPPSVTESQDNAVTKNDTTQSPGLLSMLTPQKAALSKNSSPSIPMVRTATNFSAPPAEAKNKALINNQQQWLTALAASIKPKQT